MYPERRPYIATLQLKLQREGVQVQCGAEVSKLTRDELGRVVGVNCSIGGKDIQIAALHGVILAGGDYANNSNLIARYKGNQFQEIEGINPFATGEGHLLAEQVGARLLNMEVTYGPELRFVPSSKKTVSTMATGERPHGAIDGCSSSKNTCLADAKDDQATVGYLATSGGLVV